MSPFSLAGELPSSRFSHPQSCIPMDSGEPYSSATSICSTLKKEVSSLLEASRVPAGVIDTQLITVGFPYEIMLVLWITYSLLPNGQQLVQAGYIRMEIESQDWIQASFPPEEYLEFPLEFQIRPKSFNYGDLDNIFNWHLPFTRLSNFYP